MTYSLLQRLICLVLHEAVIRFSRWLSRPTILQPEQIHWSASLVWYQRGSLTLFCTLDPAVPSTPRTACSLQDPNTWWGTTILNSKECSGTFHRFRSPQCQFVSSYSAVISVSVSIRPLSEFPPRRPWCCLNCRRKGRNWTQLPVWSRTH